MQEQVFGICDVWNHVIVLVYFSCIHKLSIFAFRSRLFVRYIRFFIKICNLDVFIGVLTLLIDKQNRQSAVVLYVEKPYEVWEPIAVDIAHPYSGCKFWVNFDSKGLDQVVRGHDTYNFFDVFSVDENLLRFVKNELVVSLQ